MGGLGVCYSKPKEVNEGKGSGEIFKNKSGIRTKKNFQIF